MQTSCLHTQHSRTHCKLGASACCGGGECRWAHMEVSSLTQCEGKGQQLNGHMVQNIVWQRQGSAAPRQEQVLPSTRKQLKLHSRMFKGLRHVPHSEGRTVFRPLKTSPPVQPQVRRCRQSRRGTQTKVRNCPRSTHSRWRQQVQFPLPFSHQQQPQLLQTTSTQMECQVACGCKQQGQSQGETHEATYASHESHRTNCPTLHL